MSAGSSPLPDRRLAISPTTAVSKMAPPIGPDMACFASFNPAR